MASLQNHMNIHIQGNNIFCRLKIHQVLINPTALRKAKIVYNFGLSECNRVKVAI